MKSKLHINNYSKLDFLINNFFEIVEYKRGRGLYGDRIILRRPKDTNCIFGTRNKFYEFYYLDANDVKEYPMTVSLRINLITRIVTSPQDMNILCDFMDSADWAIETADKLAAAGIDFEVLNNILLDRYKLLDNKFKEKLQRHRVEQYTLASSKEMEFIPQEYADKQIARM